MHTHTHTHHAKFHSRMEHKHDHWAPKWEHYTEHRWAEQLPCMHTHITHTLMLHTHIPAFVTLVTPIGLPCSPSYSLSSHTYQSQLLGCLLNEIFLFQNWYDLTCTLSTPHMCTVTSTYSQLHPHTHHYTRTYVPSHLPLRHPLRVRAHKNTPPLLQHTYTLFAMTWMTPTNHLSH